MYLSFATFPYNIPENSDKEKPVRYIRYDINFRNVRDAIHNVLKSRKRNS